MTERRNAERFPLVEPSVGTLRVLQDVEILRLGLDEAIVLAASRPRRGERLLLEIPRDGEPPLTVLVRVAWSRAVVGHGDLQWEVLLWFTREENDRMVDADLQAPLSTRPRVGGLIRHVPVRVVEVSQAGCSFESPTSVSTGAVGFIDVASHGARHSEVVRICRISPSEDPVWSFKAGAQLLTLGPASLASVRGIATIMAVGPPLSGPIIRPQSQWPRVVDR